MEHTDRDLDIEKVKKNFIQKLKSLEKDYNTLVKHEEELLALPKDKDIDMVTFYEKLLDTTYSKTLYSYVSSIISINKDVTLLKKADAELPGHISDELFVKFLCHDNGIDDRMTEVSQRYINIMDNDKGMDIFAKLTDKTISIEERNKLLSSFVVGIKSEHVENIFLPEDYEYTSENIDMDNMSKNIMECVDYISQMNTYLKITVDDKDMEAQNADNTTREAFVKLVLSQDIEEYNKKIDILKNSMRYLEKIQKDFQSITQQKETDEMLSVLETAFDENKHRDLSKVLSMLEQHVQDKDIPGLTQVKKDILDNLFIINW